MREDCSACIHAEKCGQATWLKGDIEYNIKYLGINTIICAVMRDYNYYFLYEDGDDRISKCQITKEEFNRVEKWINDTEAIERMKSRKLGCCKCNEAATNCQQRSCMEKKGISMVKQAELYRCKECGTYWEYGVYKYLVVDDSYAKKYYQQYNF